MAEEAVQAIEEESETVGDALMGAKVTELDAVLDVKVEITAVLGTTMMPISNVLQLGRGAVVAENGGVARANRQIGAIWGLW